MVATSGSKLLVDSAIHELRELLLPMATVLPSPPRVGMVSLGCPKNLVDSERILTKLRSDGYQMSPNYAGADVVLVNTCGFLDSAKEESLEAIGEALSENGRVIVTGCITSGCIRASVIDAFSLGFRVMVPRDCVGDHDATAHEQNLKDIERRYGDVIDSATAIAAIEGLRGRNDLPGAVPAG